MKLWLADYQRMGAAFLYKGLDYNYKYHYVVNGHLLFPDGTNIPVKVKMLVKAQSMIIGIYGAESIEEAKIEYLKLLQKRREAILNNTNKIRMMILCRNLNCGLWLVILLSELYALCKSMYLYLANGSFFLLVLSVSLFALLVYTYLKRYTLIRALPFPMEAVYKDE